MSAVKHTPVVIDLDGVTVMTDHKHGHHTICRSASPDSAAFIVQAVNSHYALIEALEAFRSFGCPVCNGDCSGANPPVLACPMLMASRALSLAKGEQA